MALNDIISQALDQMGYSGTLNEKEAAFFQNYPAIAAALSAAIAKTPTILAQSAVPASVTGTTTPTVLASVVIPAGAMGPNGSLRVTTQWSYTNNANLKTAGITFGGVSFMASAQSTTSGLQYQTNIRNRGVQNSQVGYGVAAGAAFTATTTANATGSVNTANAQSLNIVGTLGTSTDTATLEGYTVEVLNP